MELELLFNNRHSCRSFLKKEISYEEVKNLVDKARLAPSACNSQPTKVIITTNNEDNKKVLKVLQDEGKNKFLDNASAFVIILEAPVELKPGSETKFANDKFVKYDVGQFVAYLTLYAEYKGISNIVIGWVNNETLKQNFDIKGYNCSLVVALGYTNEKALPKKNRKKIDEIILNGDNNEI